jgi:hypothetical protein
VFIVASLLIARTILVSQPELTNACPFGLKPQERTGERKTRDKKITGASRIITDQEK